MQQIVNLLGWWRGLLGRVGGLLKQEPPRCEHFVTFVFWRPSWLGKVKEYKEVRCRLHAPLLGERVSPSRTCRVCEYNKAAAGAGRRIPIRTETSKVPTV